MLRRLLLFALPALCLLTFNACRDKVTPPEPPNPPHAPGWLSVINIADTSVTLGWEDHSSNELGFIVHLRRAGNWAAVDTVPVNTVQGTVSGLAPATPYQFYVTAYNDDGESSTTNIAAATTGNTPSFSAPYDVQALPLAETTVRITWAYHDDTEFFLLQRRTPATVWTLLDTVANALREYRDDAAAPTTDYFYRVATSLRGAVAWSDSAACTTPAPGVPAPPESLRVDIVLGVGVVLHWADRSFNETRFIIARAPSGQTAAPIDSVPANETAFTDSLRSDMGFYYYRVCAANAHGYSAWSPAASADYRYCSNGVIPLCLGNYWDYHVDTTGTTHDYDTRRKVDSVAFFYGEDFYLLRGSDVPLGSEQPLYFLHNLDGFGCAVFPYPAGPDPNPEILFHYPGQPGDFYFVQGDCVLVAENSATLQIGSTLYRDVYIYQRFFTSQHTIQYFVKPETIGILREVERLTPTLIAAQRTLIAYFVQNVP
jgi:hypothetical protein